MQRSDCEALDRADPLAGKRSSFVIPEGLIYLDGNSLGVLPRNVPGRIAEVAERQWGQSLITAWNHRDDIVRKYPGHSWEWLTAFGEA